MSIVVNDLRKSYRDVRALRGTSFHVDDGELFVLLGPEGSGKSAVISCLSMITIPDSGTFAITGRMGEPLDLAGHLGVVFQSTRLDPELTVRQNIAFHASLMGMTAEDWGAEMDELAFRLDLVEVLNRRLSRLTPGEQRRTDIARAVIHRPQVLLMDEPVRGLDPTSSTLIWKLIADQREMGTTILLATDQPDMAEEADTVAILVGGRIVAEGSPASLVGGNSVLTLRLADPLACREELDACGIQMPQPDAHQVVTWSLESGMARDVLSLLSDKVADFSFQQGTLADVFKSWVEQPIPDDQGRDEEAGQPPQEQWVWNGPVIAEVGSEDSQYDQVADAVPEATDNHVIAGPPSDDVPGDKAGRDWPGEPDSSDMEDTLDEDDFAPLPKTWLPVVGPGGLRPAGDTGPAEAGSIPWGGRVYPTGEGMATGGQTVGTETSQFAVDGGGGHGRQTLSNGQDGDMSMRYGETSADKGVSSDQWEDPLDRTEPVTSEKWNRARRFADTGRRMQSRRPLEPDTSPAEDVDPLEGVNNPAEGLRGGLQDGASGPPPGLRRRPKPGASIPPGMREPAARRPASGQPARSTASPGTEPSSPPATRSGRVLPPASGIRPGQPPMVTPAVRPGQSPAQTSARRPGQRPVPGVTPGQSPAQTPGTRPGQSPAQTPGTRPGQSPAQTPGTRPGQSPAQTPGTRPGQPPVSTANAAQSAVPAPEATPWQPPQVSGYQSYTTMFQAAAADAARQDYEAQDHTAQSPARRLEPATQAPPAQDPETPTRTPEARATPPASAAASPALRSITVRALAVPPTPWPRVPSTPRTSRPGEPARSASSADTPASTGRPTAQPTTAQPTTGADAMPPAASRALSPDGPAEDKFRTGMDSWGSLASRLGRTERPATSPGHAPTGSKSPTPGSGRPATYSDHPTSSSDSSAPGLDRPAPSSDSLSSSSDISSGAPNWGSLASRLDRAEAQSSSPDRPVTSHRWPPMPGEEERSQPVSDRWPPLPSRLSTEPSAPTPEYSYGEDRWPFRTGGIDDPLFGRHRGSRDPGSLPSASPAGGAATGESQDRLFVMSRLLKDAVKPPALPSFDELFPSERLPFVGTGDPEKTHFFRREAALTDELRRPVDEEMAKQARIQLAVEKRIAAARNRRGDKSEDE